MKEISVAKGIRTQQFYRIVTWRNDRSSGENERLARSNLELIIKKHWNKSEHKKTRTLEKDFYENYKILTENINIICGKVEK